VLVVDDNRDAADSLAILAGLWGYRTSVAYDGPTALDLYRKYRPRLLLLDLGLPGVDGFEVARRIRSEFAGDGTVIIAVTGYGREQDRQRCTEAGMDHFLLKPVDFVELRGLLQQALGRVC
jgi:CheY-like chemotaxis protein